MCLNTCFQFLNNITRISTHFFIHTYFQKKWKLLFKHTYQTYPNSSDESLFFLCKGGWFNSLKWWVEKIKKLAQIDLHILKHILLQLYMYEPMTKKNNIFED